LQNSRQKNINIFYSNPKKMFFTKLKKYKYLMFLIFWFLFGLIRLLPYLSTQIPLGYDPGIYVFLFHDYGQLLRNFDFTLLAHWNQHEPLLWILASLLWKIWISAERLVRRWIGIVSMIPWFVLVAIFRKKNKRIGFISAIFYRISIAQYEAFYRAYFKQIFWISVLLLSLYFLQNKKSLFYWISILFLVLLHRHTALYWILITVIFLIFNTIHDKKIPRKLLLTISVFALIWLLVYRSQRDKLFVQGWTVLTTTFFWKWMWWIFMHRQERLKFTIIPVVFSFIWVYSKIKNKEYDVWFIWYFLWIIRIVLQLVNYNRTIIFLDIFVIILSATWLQFLIKNYKKIGITFFSISIVVSSILYIKHYKENSKPLINESEFQAIQSFKTTTEQNAIIMNTHRNYTPRIMWYSGRDRISPGYSDLDARTREQRNIRRTSNGTVKCELLKNYYSDIDRPIYLRFGELQYSENLQWATCLSIIKTWPTYKIAKFSLN